MNVPDKELGFIGMGGMGSRMAARLLAAGYDVTIYNRHPEPTVFLEKRGAKVAPGLYELGANADIVFSSLADDTAVGHLLERAAAAYAERRQALVRAFAEHDLAAWGLSGFNVWLPIADEHAAVRRLLEAGWAVAAGERFRHRTRPGIRISIGSLLPDEAPRLAEALALSTEHSTRTRSA